MLDARLERVFARRRQKGILLDTNLFVLFAVGSFDPSRIDSFKRTRAYTCEDFEFLLEILRKFDRIITTPNILTEVSNLLGQFSEHEAVRALLARHLKRFVAERYVSTLAVCAQPAFDRLGLTDVAIGALAKKKYLVLTTDLDLYLHLNALRLEVINFNHIRPTAAS